MNYEICETNLTTLAKRLNRLNVKLTRIGMPLIRFTVPGFTDKPDTQNADKLVRHYNVVVECDAPVCNGWEFVATIVHTEEGNIFRAVPGYEVPKAYRECPTYCEHCKTNRQRNDTYIVRHTDGRTMQVGSSCLEEFLGHSAGIVTKAAQHILNAYDVCEAAQKPEWLGGKAAPTVFRLDLETFLGYVAAVVLQQGQYVTRKMAMEQQGRVTSTASAALDGMNKRRTIEVTPEAEKLAIDAREYVLKKYSAAIDDPDGMSDDAVRDMIIGSFKKANTKLSDFEHNLLSCARSEAIEPRLCGIAAYIVETYRRSEHVAKPSDVALSKDGLLRIFEMFATAVSGKLKHPSIRLADDQDQRLNLSLAAETSKNPGYIYVKGNQGYLGKISPTGVFMPVSICPPTVKTQLLAFAADPETIAAKYGKLTGCCCFCNRKLDDDRSTEVGYGPVCAKKFGLNWGTHQVASGTELAHAA